MAVQNEIVDTRRINPENVAQVPTTPLPEYGEFSPILDRVQVKVLDEMVKDESGVMVPPKYRQHSNKGIVVEVGQWVVLGGKQIPLIEVVKPGDKVLFGEYNCEKFVEGGEEYELVRVQDIRGVERLQETNNDLEQFKADYHGHTSRPDTQLRAVLEDMSDLTPEQQTRLRKSLGFPPTQEDSVD